MQCYWTRARKVNVKVTKSQRGVLSLRENVKFCPGHRLKANRVHHQAQAQKQDLRQLIGENNRLRQELEAFDLSFFEQIEDLKQLPSHLKQCVKSKIATRA